MCHLGRMVCVWTAWRLATSGSSLPRSTTGSCWSVHGLLLPLPPEVACLDTHKTTTIARSHRRQWNILAILAAPSGSNQSISNQVLRAPTAGQEAHTQCPPLLNMDKKVAAAEGAEVVIWFCSAAGTSTTTMATATTTNWRHVLAICPCRSSSLH